MDQMPLHRNESSGEKTLNFAGIETFVKENYMLSRERATFLTRLSSDKGVLPTHVVFKGVGTRIINELTIPDGVKVFFAPKGSYR